jgi:ABC-type uncharacterized transport system permease subunit
MAHRLREVAVPILTVLIAFVIAGFAILAAGANPFTVYARLFENSGLSWPLQFLPGNPLNVDPRLSELYLTSTIVVATPLVLTGLAVAFAFRCGLFNIGGQGQLWVGATAGFLVTNALHAGALGIVAGVVAATLGGMAWGAIPGVLKATRGAHEVISTIMLNFVAIYTIAWMFGLGGPFVDQGSGQPVSESLTPSEMYPKIWGQGLGVDLGALVALAACVVYWAILNRTSLGFAVRAVGQSPEAARYGGVSVKRATVLAMALSGGFAGLAGIGSVLGVDGSIATSNVVSSQVAFTGIAVALLGRNRAVGILLAALLFAALSSGSRALGGEFDSELAGALSTMIQGLIILLVGAERLASWLLGRTGRLRVRLRPDAGGGEVAL